MSRQPTKSGAYSKAPASYIVTAVDARRESSLRYQDWRISRMEAVDKASKGRIGCLHLRAMGRDDIADFAKDFYAVPEGDPSRKYGLDCTKQVHQPKRPKTLTGSCQHATSWLTPARNL